MNSNDILQDIHALEQDLQNMERIYGILSDENYAAYIEGIEPEDDEQVLDFGEWASVYKMWLIRQTEYHNEISRLQ